MPSQAIVSIDAMGGELAPRAVVEAVARIAAAGAPAHFLLHGDERAIGPLLKEHPACAEAAEVRHTETQVSMDARPSDALRRSRGSSMWNAVASVKAGEAQVAISSGNTGALMAISKVLLRTLPNVHRPAIAASWPTPKGSCVVLDVGANVEVDARQLVEFAIMGEGFHRAIHGSARPSVGLLNVGAEDLKGNRVVQEAAQLLRDAHLDLNYEGFIEGDDISMGAVDVVVTDGFTGNIALKATEGAARLLGVFMREAYGQGLFARLGAFFSYAALKRLKARMDPRNVNGGVFLGLNGVVVKSHGGSDAQGFATALRIAMDMAQSDFGQEIERNLRRLAATDEPTIEPVGGATATPAAESAS